MTAKGGRHTQRLCTARTSYASAFAIALCAACAPQDSASREPSSDEQFVRISVNPDTVRRLHTATQFVVEGDTLTTLLPRVPIALRRSDGSFYVATYGNDNVVALLDSTGALLRTIGGIGDGPGEYRAITDLARHHGDTLLVSGGQRISMFAPNGDYVRRTQARSAVVLRGMRMLSDDRLAVGGFDRSDQQNEAPFQILNGEGETVGTAGESSPARLLYSALELPRVLNAVASGPFIYAEESFYVLRLVGADGRDSIAYSLDSDALLGVGFSDEAEAQTAEQLVNYKLTMRARAAGVERVSRRLDAIAAPSTNEVWVSMRREKSGWESVKRTFRQVGVEALETDEADDQLYETVVHLLRLTPTPQLLGEVVLPFRAMLAGPGVVLHGSYSASGDTRLEVIRLRSHAEQR